MDNAQLQKLRIAVTGADGFIGRAFVERLRSWDIPVVVIKGDVRLVETWNENFDVLYHFAAKMPVQFADSAHEAFSVNIDGVLNALEACRRNKAHMVFTSTCGVYKPDKKPFSETDSVEAPTAYAQSKLIGEMLCSSYARQYGVKSSVLRLFNVYGQGQDLNFIIPYLIKCALDGQTAEIHHPESSRDFVHVKDVVDVLGRVIKDKELFNVYNVGSGRSHTIAEIIEMIGQSCEKKISYTRIKRAEDPQPFVGANIAKAVHDLRWSVNVDLKDGIREIIENFSYTSQK